VTRPFSFASLLVLAMLTSGSARAADEAMPGRLILVKPSKLAKVIAKPPTGDTFGLPSGASDPTTGGGQIQLFKGDRADVYELPVQAAPRGWKGLGNPAGSKGFKYRGNGTTADPCKVVLVKEKIVKAVCKGGGVRLDIPAVGPVGMLLTVGTTPKTYMALFGGQEMTNTAEQLKRKNAPAPPACDCGPLTPTQFSFANGAGAGICGGATNIDGTITKDFGCGELVIGGGSSPVPNQPFQDMVHPSRLKVRECTGKNLILEPASLADTGSNLECTEPNCLFAAPLPIILPAIPQSACVYMRVDRGGRGTVKCDTGEASIDMEIQGAMFLTGDILPRRCSGGANDGGFCAALSGSSAQCDGAPCVNNPDVQPCPICNPVTGYCNGGLNGMATWDPMAANNGQTLCEPHAQQVTGPQFPTSHDCGVSSLVGLGDIPIPFLLSTGTTVRRTFNSATQQRVFCGFCRNPDTTAFEGGPGTAHPCSSDSECSPPFSVCQQRSGGAFGPNGGAYTTATEMGAPGGSLEDYQPHPGTMSGIFCIPPTFDAIIDGSSDLPGPGAVSMPGTMQLLSPSGAFVDGITAP
jgi:hypothetical protein